MATNNETLNYFLQPETSQYLMNIRAAGGNLDMNAVQAVDKFVVIGKRDGWFPLLTDVGLFLGNNLASALVRLKVPTGLGYAYTAFNFVEADYTPENGLMLTANTNKYISTGLVPSAYGLSGTNCSMLYQICQFVVEQSSYIIGVSPATTAVDSNPRVGNEVFNVGNAPGTPAYLPYETAAVSTGPASSSSFLNGIQATGLSTVSTAMTLSDEILFFKAKRQNNVEAFAKGNLAMYAIGSFLTVAQTRSLSLAAMELQRQTRPVGNQPIFSDFGDSISRGAATTFATNGGEVVWTGRLARLLGCRQVSAARGSSEIRRDSSGVTAGITRYTDVLNVKPSIISIKYGTNDMNNNDGNTNGGATEIEDYGTKLETVITGFFKQGARIIVCGPALNNVSGDLKRLKYVRRAALAAKKKRLAFAELNYLFLDTPSRIIYFPNGDTAQLHPNDLGNVLIATQVHRASMGQLWRKPPLSFPSIAAGATSVQNVEVLNAEPGMVVTVIPPIGLEAGLTMGRPVIGLVGSINVLGTITPGTGYTNGTTTLVALTGGTGTGAIATVFVVSGAVSTVTITNPGTGYVPGDSLSATIGSGTGFSVLVDSVGDFVQVSLTNTTGSAIAPAAAYYTITVKTNY